jgi:hypothetical protein
MTNNNLVIKPTKTQYLNIKILLIILNYQEYFLSDVIDKKEGKYIGVFN